MSPVLVGALLGSTVAYLKKIGKIPYTLEESLDIIMGRPIGDDVTWNNDVEVIGDEVEWKAPAPKQQKVKFPRAKADKIVKKVEKHLKPYVDKMMACGSYRRGAQMIGDIDFVVILKEGYSLPEILPSNQGVNWVGDQKAQVIIDGEKVDFRVTTPKAWGATILYFTGPADFNIKYRWMAKKRGLKLSEYGLFDRNTDKYIAGKTENDIFTALGRPYRDPADRKGFQRSAKKKAEFEAPYQPNQTLQDYSPQDLVTSSAVTGDFTTDSLKYGFGPTTLRGEMEEYAPNETDDSFTSMSNLAYITLPDYDESYYWISDDENSRATVAFDEENEVIIIPNFEVSLRVRGQGMASQYLHEMIDDLHSDFGYYPVQVIDVDNHAIGFWEKMQNQGVIDGWTQGRTFQAEDDYDATYGKEQAKIRRRLKNKIMGQAIMGTKAGQWSARKSQELKRQYEAACEKRGLRAYKGNKTKSQDNLSKWSRQKWGTASGKKSSKTGEPYFPAKAIEALKDRGLYAKAKRQKQAATKAGKQHARYSDDIRDVVKPFRADSQVNEGLQYLLGEIETTWYLNMTAIENWVEHEMAGDGLLNYWDLIDLPDGTQIDENTTKREYFDKSFESFLNRFQQGAQVGICERGLEIVGQRVLYVPVGKKVNLKSLGNWENRRADRYGVFGDPITSWTWSSDIYTGVVFGDDSIDHMEGQEGVDFDRIVLAAWIPWEAIDWASTIAFNISSHWQEHELCVNDKEPLYEVDIYRNGVLESSSDKAMNAESQHPICPLCHGYIPNDKTPGAYPGAMSRVFENMEICSSCGTAEAVGPMFGPLDDLIDEAKEQGLSGLELWSYVISNVKEYLPKELYGAESHFEAEYEPIGIIEMDRYLQNRRFKPINLFYRNRPIKEWVYERKMGIPNHYVRVYTSINRYGRNQGRARDSGQDAIRVQVIYRDNKGETLVSAPKRVHRIGTWKDNLQKRLDVIAEELPKVMFDSRGEPMTLRKYKGNYFWGSRDYPKHKETRRFQSETEEELSWQVVVVADPQDNKFYQAYQKVIEADNYNEIWEIVELVDDLNLASKKIADTKFNERRVIITVYTPGVGLTDKDDYWCEEFDEMLETL